MVPIYCLDKEPEIMKKLITTNSNYTNFQRHYDEEIKHAQIVAMLAYSTAKKIKLSEKECLEAFESALEHDLGKGDLPPSVLFSSEVYDPLENPVRGLHVDLGVFHGSKEGLPKYVLDAIQFHHETFNPSKISYPGKKIGADIPLYARLIAPADNFVAITRDRIYRKALTFKETESIMLEQDCFKFDPIILTEFLVLCYEFSRYEKNLVDVLSKILFLKERGLSNKLYL